ncbi:MAG: HD domain-containing phosphohydrolase [Oscillospiraceae bacterium]
MITYYAAASILAAVSFLLFLAFSDGKTVNSYMMLFALLLVVANGGYLATSLSTTLGEALLANKISYIGGCFIPPVIITIILGICRYRVPKFVYAIMLTYSIVVYSFVLTTGYSDLYYNDASLMRYNGASVLKRSYGPFHILFTILLYGYLAILIGIVVYTMKKKKDVSFKTIVSLMLLGAGMLAIFVLLRFINPLFEAMPAAFVFVSFMLLYLNRRLALYDVETSIMKSLSNQTTYGYVLIDKQKHYLGCNNAAKKILPDLEKCEVDKLIKEKSILEAIPCLSGAISDNGIWDFEKDSLYFECRIERTMHKNKHIGYIIEIRDNTEKHNYLGLMFNYADELKTQVDEKTAHIQSIQNKVILSMADMVENRDNNTGGHIKRTSYVVSILIDTIKENGLIGKSDEFYNDVIKAAPMHDLGKIAVDDAILRKPGRLTPEEFEVIKTHSEKSAQLVEGILRGVEEEHFVNTAVNVARYHHEKWDGSGYPEHISGESIPLEARIMAIADVYDALVSRRCYKEPMSFEKANCVMLESMGSHFDPSLQGVFELSRSKLEQYYTNMNAAVQVQ